MSVGFDPIEPLGAKHSKLHPGRSHNSKASEVAKKDLDRGGLNILDNTHSRETATS